LVQPERPACAQPRRGGGEIAARRDVGRRARRKSSRRGAEFPNVGGRAAADRAPPFPSYVSGACRLRFPGGVDRRLTSMRKDKSDARRRIAVRQRRPRTLATTVVRPGKLRYDAAKKKNATDERESPRRQAATLFSSTAQSYDDLLRARRGPNEKKNNN